MYSTYSQAVLILRIQNLMFLMQVVLSTTSLRLLPLQLGFEGFQYISLNFKTLSTKRDQLRRSTPCVTVLII